MSSAKSELEEGLRDPDIEGAEDLKVMFEIRERQQDEDAGEDDDVKLDEMYKKEDDDDFSEDNEGR
jgi:hypothetical protein